MYFLVCGIKDLQKKEEIEKTVNKYIETTNKYSESTGVLILGGDGTILKTLRSLKEKIIKSVFSLNYGTIGVLASFTKEQTDDLLKRIQCNEKFKYLSFKRLKVQGHGYFMNEVVFTNDTLITLNKFQIYLNGEHILNIRCDSIIISTPTGSSGYNLSAGGPMIYPKCNVITITAVSPFRSILKSIVVDMETEIKIIKEGKGMLVIDGCDRIPFASDLIVSYDGSYVEFASDTVNDNHFARVMNKIKCFKE